MGMTQTVHLEKWDDQELDRLFAARLPIRFIAGGVCRTTDQSNI